MFDWRSHAPLLKLDQALARLSIVLFIELVGAGATIYLVWRGPRWFSGTSVTAWQRDCLAGIGLFGGASLIALIMMLIGGVFLPRIVKIRNAILFYGPKITEGVIWLVFAMNTVFFTLGMARTGGPAESFFAQLVPIQLSGILVLQQQKLMLTGARATIWTFGTSAAFSVLTWLIAVSFQVQAVGIMGWDKTMMEGTLEAFGVFATTALFVLSVAVTVVAYWLPLQPWFIAIFEPEPTT